jgi:hypothetical protein
MDGDNQSDSRGKCIRIGMNGGSHGAHKWTTSSWPLNGEGPRKNARWRISKFSKHQSNHELNIVV